MTENVEELLARLRETLGEDRFRELLRDSLEAEQRRRDDAAVNAHLDAVAAEHSAAISPRSSSTTASADR